MWPADVAELSIDGCQSNEGALVTHYQRPVPSVPSDTVQHVHMCSSLMVWFRLGEDGQPTRSGAARSALHRQLSRPQGTPERHYWCLVGGPRRWHAHSARVSSQTAQSLAGLPHPHLHRRTYPSRWAAVWKDTSYCRGRIACMQCVDVVLSCTSRT